MERVRLLMKILEVIEEEWELQMPPMIISVAGKDHTEPFALRPKYHAMFSLALMKATEAISAWVTTGGLAGGVDKLVGEALSQAGNPLLAISPWGALKGRAKLKRPDAALFQQRTIDRNELAAATRRSSMNLGEDIGIATEVLAAYQQDPDGGVDPEETPPEVAHRVSFLEHGKIKNMRQLKLVRVGSPMATEAPLITRCFPQYGTGRLGRGTLRRWGSNQSIDTIVTRRSQSPTWDADGSGSNETHMGVQVAVVNRESDGCWALPGQFVSDLSDAVRALERQIEDHENQSRGDLQNHAVREVFEVSLLREHSEELQAELDHLFRKSAQTVIYRGYVDDARNTDNAWVESSVFHVHSPPSPAIDESLDGCSHGQDKDGRPAHSWLE
jgi:ADP-ribose pyrophosphatase YjhB (NUDIX family)